MLTVIAYAVVMIVVEILDQLLGGLLDAIFPIIPIGINIPLVIVECLQPEKYICEFTLNDFYRIFIQLILGIIGAPFSHVGVDHLFGNLTAFFPLSFLLILKGENFHRLWCALSILTGIGTWLIGIPGTGHIGASGVIFGQWSYLLAGGIFHRDVNSILSAGLCFAWLWKMYFSLVNTAPGISWEGHASGVVAGIVTAVFLKEFVSCEKSRASYSR